LSQRLSKVRQTKAKETRLVAIKEEEQRQAKAADPPLTIGLFTIKNNTEASGDVAGAATYSYVPSRGECEQNCARSANCKVFTYNKSVSSCYLYTPPFVDR